MDSNRSAFVGQDVCFNWTDVTKDFWESTEELKCGQLLHDELFGLFEAMSAIEMMDPKMDAGMVSNQTNKKVLNFEQSIKANKIKLKDFTLEEQLGIIDETLSTLITWFEGHSLAQTVFINLYLHNPSLIIDKTLRFFCKIVLKLIDSIREFVSKAQVFEEEDFQPVVYGYNLANDLSDSKACSIIREVDEELSKKTKLLQKSLDKNTESESNKQDVECHRLTCGLHNRIKFFRYLFQTLYSLKKASYLKTANRKSNANIDKQLSEDIEKYLNHCSESLLIWRQTIDCGIKPESGITSGHKADYPTIVGFEPLVNQRLLPPTFPRYTRMKSRLEALEFSEQLIQRLKRVTKIYECSSYEMALAFFNHFSQNIPNSCVLSRSILQVLYLPQPSLVFGTSHLAQVVRDSCKQFIKPPSLCTKSALINNNSTAYLFLDNFFHHAVRPMATLTQICGHNRARQREKLAQILEELTTLQDEADRVDNYLNVITQNSDPPTSHIGYYTSWVLYHILRTMTQYLLSGFELELYSLHEYQYMFWYLYEFLYGWIVSTLNRASNLILEQEALADQIQQQTKGKSKKIRPKKRKQRPHYQEILIYQSLQHLNNGFYKAICGFKNDGKLPTPQSALNTEEIRYEHRFMPFRSVIAPPPVPYIQYKDMTRNVLQQTPGELYLLSCKSFQQTKALLETISDPKSEVMSYIKIAKTNFVVMKLLLSGHQTDSQKCPEFDFSVNPFFPLISIYKK
ncbi:N-alpha-acetyltransferase 35, NatC auxiliary subunit-like [Oppia nitens]|uniref:N-alpha-acetyltransferase 35, NatC auxiliary subunit-like n=1 Tax=Oppia nitens TaxID=1686743 RepID=UPI0023DBD0A6|nr:N-alpha-acetyltransferase 35, NatC auxiliary subunit-like [Oppia nitens]